MTSRTAEDEYVQNRKQILGFEQQLVNIGSRVSALISAYQTATNQSFELFTVFGDFYSANPERLTDVSASLVSVHENIAGPKCAMLEKFMGDHVLTKIASCKNDLIELKRRMRDRETSRENFDHYYSKFLKLKADKTTLTNKGKFSAKDAERYARNEEKFRTARQSYNELNDSVVAEMYGFWTNRFLIMDPIFNECARTEILFITALNNQLKPSLDVLKQAISQPLKVQPSKPTVGQDERRSTKSLTDDYDDDAQSQVRRPVNQPLQQSNAKPTNGAPSRRPPANNQSVLNLMDEPIGVANHADEPLGDFFSPSQRAPARPVQQQRNQAFNDPFAALDSPAVSGALDPFFAPAASIAPMNEQRKKPSADVDFFSNAMSVSASSPTSQSNNLAFQSSPSLFDAPSKSKQTKSSFSNQPSLMDGLPPLGSNNDAHGDDPFAGLPLQQQAPTPPINNRSSPPQPVRPPSKPVVAPSNDLFAEAMQQSSTPPSKPSYRAPQTPPQMPSLASHPSPLDIDSPEPPLYVEPQRKSSITSLRAPPPPMPSQSVSTGFDDDDTSADNDEPGLSPVAAAVPPRQPQPLKQPPPMPRPMPPSIASPPSRPPTMPPSMPGPPRASPPSRPPPSHASFQPPPPPSHASFQPPPPPAQRVQQQAPAPAQNDFDEDSPRGPAFHVPQQAGSDPFSAFNDE